MSEPTASIYKPYYLIGKCLILTRKPKEYKSAYCEVSVMFLSFHLDIFISNSSCGFLIKFHMFKCLTKRKT